MYLIKIMRYKTGTGCGLRVQSGLLTGCIDWLLALCVCSVVNAALDDTPPSSLLQLAAVCSGAACWKAHYSHPPSSNTEHVHSPSLLKSSLSYVYVIPSCAHEPARWLQEKEQL